MSFDPNSTDAMFAKLLQRMDGQDVVLARIEAQVGKTNGRVTGLERWRDIITTRIAVISSGVSGAVALGAWILKSFFLTP